MRPKGASRHVLAACVAATVLLGLGGVALGESCQGGKVERSARRGPERAPRAESGEGSAREAATEGRPSGEREVTEREQPGPSTRERASSEREQETRPLGENDSAASTHKPELPRDERDVARLHEREPSERNESLAAPGESPARAQAGLPRGPGPAKREQRPVEDGGPRLARVSLARLDVTEGELRPGKDDDLTVDGPRMRAVVPGTTAASAELRFKVLGPTSEQRAIASGEQRQQVGLKLRALDGCNLVYVMWRIAPKPGVVVNYKRNPGQHTSRECGNGGYTTVRPKHRASVDAPVPGTSHTLRARLDGRTLRVWADGALAWEGELPEEALAFDGPVGLRSDNVRLALQLYSPLP